MTSTAQRKASRQEWIDAALASLVDTAIDQLRVLTLSKSLGVSRSSFYWFFDDPADLRAELLEVWDRNTASIAERSEVPTESIIEGCLAIFDCWADRTLYVPELDISVRDWARRDPTISARVVAADERRLAAIAAMFQRHGYAGPDALVRARLLYHSQVAYFALGTAEPIDVRLGYLPYYLEAMTGVAATPAQLATFAARVSPM